MSKSKGNVVDPQYIVDRYGADTVRVFMLFASPPDKDSEWSDEGVKGAFRFLNRVWRLFDENLNLLNNFSVTLPVTSKLSEDGSGDEGLDNEVSANIKKLRYSTHFTIKKVLNDIENRMQFNTAIAAVMEHLNNVYSIKNVETLNDSEKAVFVESCVVIPHLMYVFAPHLSEELWKMIGKENLLHEAGLPKFNDKYLVQDEITYVIQIMGKVRGKINVSLDATDDEIRKLALEVENVKKSLEGKDILKMIIVPKKLVSIVAR